MTNITDGLSFTKKVGNFVSNILLGETKELIIRTDERVSSLKYSVGDLKVSMTNLTVALNTHGLDIRALQVHTKFGINNSPTIPNGLGQKVLSDSKFSAQYPELKTKVFILMDAMNLRTLYDYEEGAFKALKQLERDPVMDPIKDYSVNHPDSPLDLVFKIGSWVLRDDYAKFKKA